MKRAYIATQVLEYIVVANTPEEAKRLAVKAIKDDCVLTDADAFELGPLSHIPGIYDGLDDTVHHDGSGDLTVREATRLPGGYAHQCDGAKGPDDQ
jgi:hypothetical protein